MNQVKIKVGDLVTISANLGHVGARTAAVTHLEPPRHSASTGHVRTSLGRYYAGVYNSRFIEEDGNWILILKDSAV